MATYTIQISETQRLALIELLVQNPSFTRVDSELGFDADLAYWDKMLEKLPFEEYESPGCIHGFCY